MDASLAHSGFGCPLCFASYTSEGPRMPLILHCGHSSCQQCVDLFQTSSVSENSLCPLCMVEGTQTPSKNYALIEIMDQLVSDPISEKCSLCSEKDGTIICRDCPPHTRKQCSECSTYLHALKNLRKHETLPLSSPPHPLSQGIEPKAILSENSRKVNEHINLGQLSAAFLTARRCATSDPDSAALLALCLFDGHGTPISLKHALKWAQYSSDHDSKLGKAVCLYLQKDFEGALPGFLSFAESGFSSAQRCVGRCCEPTDPSKSIQFYERAVEQGHPAAQNNLGMMYVWGKGVEKDLGMALYYLQLSVEKGHAMAINNLANLYFRGDGVEQDYVVAIKYYRLASESNHPVAQNNLGLRYLYGQGVEKNLPLAVYYFGLSSDQGEALGKCNLGYCYGCGSGVEKNDRKAVELFTSAAESGDDVAQKNLARRYEQGRGVSVDLAQARKFYGLSAAQGNSQAIEALQRLDRESSAKR